MTILAYGRLNSKNQYGEYERFYAFAIKNNNTRYFDFCVDTFLYSNYGKTWDIISMWSHIANTWCEHIIFKNEEDALAFKLRWV